MYYYSGLWSRREVLQHIEIAPYCLLMNVRRLTDEMTVILDFHAANERLSLLPKLFGVIVRYTRHFHLPSGKRAPVKLFERGNHVELIYTGFKCYIDAYII